MKIIDRYILREMFLPFFMSLFVTTFLLMTGKILQLAEMVVNRGMNIADVIKLILYLMPSFLLFTIPISLLISILTGLGRLASDNEITVLKGAGISLYGLLNPIAIASCISLMITASLSLFFVPHSSHAVKNLLFNIVQQNAGIGIKERIFNDNFKGLLLYADRMTANGRYLEGIIISDNRTSGEPSTIFAEKASLISDPASRTLSLRLEKGSTHRIDIKRKSYRKMDFSSYDINLDMDAALRDKERAKDSTEMTPGELLKEIRAPGIEKAVQRELRMELHKKFTVPITCIIFGLLGVPLGIRVRKSAKARGFTLGITIVLLYYLAQSGSTALMETGRISPVLGAWFPVVIFTLAGFYLLAAAAKEKMSVIDSLKRISNIIREKGKLQR